jgi:hypothetical protein
MNVSIADNSFGYVTSGDTFTLTSKKSNAANTDPDSVPAPAIKFVLDKTHRTRLCLRSAAFLQ